MYHYVSGFKSNGEITTFAVQDLAEVDQEQAIMLSIEERLIRDSGFYFVTAPDTEGQANLAIVNVKLTNPVELKNCDQNDIFLGLSHDE